MSRLCSFVFMLCVIFSPSWGHKLSYGECPNVPPMAGFDMRRMTGLWYVIEKTKTSSSCATYTFRRTDTPGVYELEQNQQASFFGSGQTTGMLYGEDHRYPASMRAEFPMSIGGSANYKIFATNYDDYAGIFSCQKILFTHRYSVSILSRKPYLPERTIDMLHSMMLRRHVDPAYLNRIPQDNCPDHQYNPKEDMVEFIGDVVSAGVGGSLSRRSGKIAESDEYVRFDKDIVRELIENPNREAYMKVGDH